MVHWKDQENQRSVLSPECQFKSPSSAMQEEIEGEGSAL